MKTRIKKPTLVKNKLRVAHHPNIPCQAFTIEVRDEYSARDVVNALAVQHIWLFENGFINDYANVLYVEMLDSDGVWGSYYNETEEMEWEEFEECYLSV